MKLYSRQLNSLEELRREKHVLRYAIRHTDDWLSLKELDRKETDTGEAAGAGMLGTLISALASRSLFSTVLAIAPPLITLLSRRSSSHSKKKNPLEALARDVLFGYLKWKAIHFAYRTLSGMLGSDKDSPKKEK